MKLTRKELYDLVWSEPMTAIARRFGLSDNGLRKQCKTMNIPTPTLGYWAKLQHGKTVEKIPLPEKHDGNKHETTLHAIDMEKLKKQEEEQAQVVNRFQEIENDIKNGDTSVFVVPEVLYAKEPFIIDTKEKYRRQEANEYLKRSPYKSKIKDTLDLYVSPKSTDRALCIFSTVINALRFRGHKIKFKDDSTYAVVDGEEIRVSISERRRMIDKATRETDFCGELHFKLQRDRWDEYVYNDTAHTRLEDKIISIIAMLEYQSERIKEKRIEEERRRQEREEEERQRIIFQKKQREELEEFKSLFLMADRLHKTNILRQYINIYEEQAIANSSLNEEVLSHLKWARKKADWLDPFVNKPDKYLDTYDKDKVTRPDCPKTNSWESQDLSVSRDSFWAKPYWRR